MLLHGLRMPMFTYRLAAAPALGLLSILCCRVGTAGQITARGRRSQMVVFALGRGGQGLVVVVRVLVTVRGRLRLVIDGHLVGHASVSGGDVVGSTDRGFTGPRRRTGA
jgi:hypothetical protein